jgi:CMP-N,N'-diacetyllegionaminic acid synthase
MELLITVCARGGSKGIPRKNIRPVAGTPLIAYSIRHALAFARETQADVTLSTDDEEIRTIAASYGLNSTYTRPGALATDVAGKLPVLRDVLEYEERQRSKRYDILLDLDVTSPLRTLEDLREGFAEFLADPKALTLFSVSPPKHNPYFDMVERADDSYVSISKVPTQAVLSRQTGPRVFELNASFYFYRRLFFETERTTPITECTRVYVMPHMCFELDELIDYEFLEYLVGNGKLDFSFT